MKLLLCLTLFITIAASGQRRCLQSSVSENTKPSVLSAGREDFVSDELITIPIVIHILYSDPSQNISDAAVMSQLAVLNKDFRKQNSDINNVPPVFASVSADARIKFCLARSDPQGRPSTGIIHKHTNISVWTADDAMKFSFSGGDDAWDSKRYLNVWVCNLYGRNLGYATLPGGSAVKDGVVIQYDVFGTIGSMYPFNKGRTATHEIGHWLGLRHMWGDAECGDDGIADTPPQQTYNNGCPQFPHISLCSVSPSGDMFMNFMDFTDDACMHLFTEGQKTKMRSLFLPGGLRNSILSSSGCDSVLAQGGPVSPDTTLLVKKISVYPNPASSYFSIRDNSNQIIGQSIRMYNVQGIEVMNGKLTLQINNFNISGLPSGIYMIKFGEGKTFRPLKLIKL